MRLNYFAFTATKKNSYSVGTMLNREVGDEYLHSVFGRGIVVRVEPLGTSRRITVRTDITLNQLIEAL